MLEAALTCLVTNTDVFSRTGAEWDGKPGKYMLCYSLCALRAATPATAAAIQVLLLYIESMNTALPWSP